MRGAHQKTQVSKEQACEQTGWKEEEENGCGIDDRCSLLTRARRVEGTIFQYLHPFNFLCVIFLQFLSWQIQHMYALVGTMFKFYKIENRAQV